MSGCLIDEQQPSLRVAYCPVSWGELVDKISILEIKLEAISSPEKLQHLKTEHALLRGVYESGGPKPSGMGALEYQMKEINQRLWDLENEVRALARRGELAQAFINASRSIQQLNESRAYVKRQINLLTGSTIIEEKDYSGCDRSERSAHTRAAE